MEFIYGVLTGVVALVVGLFFVWKNNKQAVAKFFADKASS